MHFLDFFRIVEQDRDLLNPVGPEKIDALADTLGVREGTRVLDVGSGKGAMLRRWAARWALEGTGLELNPAFVADARARAHAEGVANRLTFVEGPALDFHPNGAGHDAVACLGATFALGGFAEAAEWMRAALGPGGALAVGDVFLAAPADPERLEREGWAGLPTLEERFAALEVLNLEVVGLQVSGPDEWDRYSGLMWSAAHRWAAEHPDHPDRAEVLARVREGRARYFRFERDHLGWAIFAARERS